MPVHFVFFVVFLHVGSTKKCFLEFLGVPPTYWATCPADGRVVTNQIKSCVCWMSILLGQPGGFFWKMVGPIQSSE